MNLWIEPSRGGAVVRTPAQVLTGVVESLSTAADLPSLTGIVASAARELTGADGATFVLREDGHCYYADEDAISPLWKGSRFPLETCISGVAMKTREVIVIPDVRLDERIPQNLYQPTFVKSLCMIPIRPENPVGAIGNYWRSGHCPSPEEIKLLQILANSTAIALENLELRERLTRQQKESSHLPDRLRELETAVQTLAHDLRNPLATMMLLAEVLQARLGGRLDEALLGYFKSIRQTGLRANEQIQKMLSLAGLTQRKIEPASVDLSALTTEIAELLRAQAPTRQMTVRIAPGLRVQADPVLVRLALENLLANAFKYTSKVAEARIEVFEVSRGPRLATFCVRDNGVGFSPAEAPRLFRPLVRLHQDPDFPGTGLGLASAARIIEMHGGKMRAEGQENQGATFYFELPLDS